MIDPQSKTVSISKQCRFLVLSRSGFYSKPKGESVETLHLMRLIDQKFLKTPFYGSRQMALRLTEEGHLVSRHRVRRLMRKMGIQAIYQTPRTSEPHPEHKIYPYLLRNMQVTRPNQVWCSDITYIPIGRGFLYLVAIMDWYSRCVFSWRLSNTMEKDFCCDALEGALEKHGQPDVFNTDQGSQFTSLDFTKILKKREIKISMDGRGRWVDNVFIERLWRSLKYECIYLEHPQTGKQAREVIEKWIYFYNTERPHSTFKGKTPAHIFHGFSPTLTYTFDEVVLHKTPHP